MNNLEIQLGILRNARREIIKILDMGFEFGVLAQKERDIMYYRYIDWNSLENCGKKFGVTRERIRQIEAKAMKKIRSEKI